MNQTDWRSWIGVRNILCVQIATSFYAQRWLMFCSPVLPGEQKTNRRRPKRAGVSAQSAAASSLAASAWSAALPWAHLASPQPAWAGTQIQVFVVERPDCNFVLCTTPPDALLPSPAGRAKNKSASRTLRSQRPIGSGIITGGSGMVSGITLGALGLAPPGMGWYADAGACCGAATGADAFIMRS